MSHELAILDGPRSSDAIENAQPLDEADRGVEPQVQDAEFSLAPVDTGKQAWLFLAACWVVEAFTFGELF